MASNQKQVKNQKVEILKPVSGTFGISASPGDKKTIKKALADEMIELGFAKKA